MPPEIVPQFKHSRKGWLTCQPHRATHWAVYHRGQFIARTSKRKAANIIADRIIASTPAKRPGPPGSRYGALGVRGSGRIIASSRLSSKKD